MAGGRINLGLAVRRLRPLRHGDQNFNNSNNDTLNAVYISCAYIQ